METEKSGFEINSNNSQLANLPHENPICYLLLKIVGSKKLLPGISPMKVISWKNMPVFTEIILLLIRKKHNSNPWLFLLRSRRYESLFLLPLFIMFITCVAYFL